VQAGYLIGWIGTLTSRERDDAAFAEMQVRALTGGLVAARTDRRHGPTDGADRPGRTSPAPSKAP